MAERYEYSGIAVDTKSSGAITDASMSLTIADPAGWPTGAVGKFHLVIDEGQSTEEKIQVLSRSGNTLTLHARGIDGTAAHAHAIHAPVRHVFIAEDADRFNRHAADPTLDDHSQYVHKSIARTITAAHTHTGAEVHNGNEKFNGSIDFNGAVSFAGTPTFANMGATADLRLIGTGAADAGTSSKPMRADARPALDLIALERVMWKAGDLKLSSTTAPITSEWLECNGQTFNKTTYPNLAIVHPSGTVPDFRDRIISGGGMGGARAVNGEGGSDTITLVLAQLPPHSHGVVDPGHTHAVTDPGHKHNMDGDSGNRFLTTINWWTTGLQAGEGAQAVAPTDIDTAMTGVTVAPATTGVVTHTVGSGAPITAIPRWRGARVLIKAH